MILLYACENDIASNSSINPITSDDEIDTIENSNAEPESKQESDQNELDLEELKLMVPDATEYFKESSEVVSDSYVNFEGTAYYRNVRRITMGYRLQIHFYDIFEE